MPEALLFEKSTHLDKLLKEQLSKHLKNLNA